MLIKYCAGQWAEYIISQTELKGEFNGQRGHQTLSQGMTRIMFVKLRANSRVPFRRVCPIAQTMTSTSLIQGLQLPIRFITESPARCKVKVKGSGSKKKHGHGNVDFSPSHVGLEGLDAP